MKFYSLSILFIFTSFLVHAKPDSKSELTMADYKKLAERLTAASGSLELGISNFKAFGKVNAEELTPEDLEAWQEVVCGENSYKCEITRDGKKLAANVDLRALRDQLRVKSSKIIEKLKSDLALVRAWNSNLEKLKAAEMGSMKGGIAELATRIDTKIREMKKVYDKDFDENGIDRNRYNFPLVIADMEKKINEADPLLIGLMYSSVKFNLLEADVIWDDTVDSTETSLAEILNIALQSPNKSQNIKTKEGTNSDAQVFAKTRADYDSLPQFVTITEPTIYKFDAIARFVELLGSNATKPVAQKTEAEKSEKTSGEAVNQLKPSKSKSK